MDAPSSRSTVTAFPLAAGMASLAGATDVCGLGVLRDLFVSFMSGNTTLLGVALGQADWARARFILWLIGLFVAGAAAGAALGEVGGQRHAALVATAVALALAIPLLQPSLEAQALVVAMGALNASMSRIGQASISLTYVTGTLVKLGQGIGRALCGRPDGWSWMWQAPMWLSLLAGATAATLVRQKFGAEMLWPLPAYALALAVAAFATSRESHRHGTVPPVDCKGATRP